MYESLFFVMNAYCFSVHVMALARLFCRKCACVSVAPTTTSTVVEPSAELVVVEAEWMKYPMFHQQVAIMRCASIPVIQDVHDLYHLRNGCYNTH